MALPSLGRLLLWGSFLLVGSCGRVGFEAHPAGSDGSVADGSPRDGTSVSDGSVADGTPGDARCPGPTCPPSVPVELLGSWVAGDRAAMAGTSRVLVLVTTAVGYNEQGITVTNATYGGLAMTFVAHEESASADYDALTEVWILDEAGIAAASGSSYAVSWSGSPYATRNLSAFYQYVDQTNPVGAVATTQVDAADPDVLTTAPLMNRSGDMTLAVSSGRGLGSFTPQNGFVEHIDVQYNGGCGDCFTHAVADKPASGVDEVPSIQHSALGSHALIGVVLQAE